jgi:hypothetical protein
MDATANSCPIPCQLHALTAAQSSFVDAALKYINHSDPECVNLASFALTLRVNGRVKSYDDERAGTPWADVHFASYGWTDWNAEVHLASKTLKDSRETTLSMLHEATHAYYGISDAGNIPELTAQRCYSPLG